MFKLGLLEDLIPALLLIELEIYFLKDVFIALVFNNPAPGFPDVKEIFSFLALYPFIFAY